MRFHQFLFSVCFVSRAGNFNRYKFTDFPKPYPGIDIFLSIAWLADANLIRTDACERPPLAHKLSQNSRK
jgi:hypothetical protein